MPEITLEHVRQAAEWAKQAMDAPKPIDGETRKYNQGQWDCGTSCCMWGAASLIAGAGAASGPPPREWCVDAIHTAAHGLMCSGTSTPDMMLALLRKANLRGANLRGANLRGADLREANLSEADLLVLSLVTLALLGIGTYLFSKIQI